MDFGDDDPFDAHPNSPSSPSSPSSSSSPCNELIDAIAQVRYKPINSPPPTTVLTPTFILSHPTPTGRTSFLPALSPSLTRSKLTSPRVRNSSATHTRRSIRSASPSLRVGSASQPSTQSSPVQHQPSPAQPSPAPFSPTPTRPPDPT